MSSPAARTTSSGSDSDPQAPMNQRKRRRMESNRESARRSRMRKQQRMDDLVNEVARLEQENGRVAAQIEAYAQRFAKVDSENAVLTAQVMELTERLQSMNSVLRFVEDFSGMTLDIPDLPDLPNPLLPPWQLPCPSQPIMASVDMLQC